MKRRRRGQLIPDPLPGTAAQALRSRLAGVEETLRQTSSALVQTRTSRDRYKARARQLETAAAAARRHPETVAAEQAAKTAALRSEVAALGRQLADAVAAREERQTAADAEAAGKYRQRLAEGNAAYAQLLKDRQELRNALEKARTDNARTEHDWDTLCRRLYQSTKGRPSSDADRRILNRWITWKNQQHQNDQARKKAAGK